MNTTDIAVTQAPVSNGAGNVILRWLLFFAVSLGFGYAAVTRYDPRQLPGLTDSIVYTRMVAGDSLPPRDLRFRILVPYVARPFYLIAKQRLTSDKAALLALLIANSLFCASSASLLVAIAMRLTGDPATALLSAMLYLSSFAITNLQLSGLVDSGEACFVLAVTLSCLTDKWRRLPLWALLGALAKETFVPLATVFAFTWWFLDDRKSPRAVRRLLWTIAMSVVGFATITILQSIMSGHPRWPGQTPVQQSEVGYVVDAMSLFNRSFWYVFGWLLPLGIWRLRDLPRPWVYASAAAAFAALALGVYNGIEGNVARPIFNVAGPMLSLATALLLTRYPNSRLQPIR